MQRETTDSKVAAIDGPQIESLRRSIAAGTYSVDPRRIASSILMTLGRAEGHIVWPERVSDGGDGRSPAGSESHLPDLAA